MVRRLADARMTDLFPRRVHAGLGWSTIVTASLVRMWCERERTEGRQEDSDEVQSLLIGVCD